MVEEGTIRIAEHENLHTSCDGLLEICSTDETIVAFVSNQRADVEVRSR